jgi:hypothetical protein
LLLEIFTSDMIPKMSARGAVRRNVQKLKIPSTSEVIARALVFALRAPAFVNTQPHERQI